MTCDLGPSVSICFFYTFVGYGWFLEKVVIHDVTHGMTYMVPCQKWLSAREDDGKTVREFYVELSAEYIHRKSKLSLPSVVLGCFQILCEHKFAEK